METERPLSTLLPTHVKLSKNDFLKFDDEKNFMSKIPYHCVVYSLMYVMIAIRLDIAFAMGVVSRFSSNFGMRHCEAIKMILRYVSGTKNKSLCLVGIDLSIIEYIDFECGGCSNIMKSTLGYIFQIVGGAISWRSRLQGCKVVCTTEAKYVAISGGI